MLGFSHRTSKTLSVCLSGNPRDVYFNASIGIPFSGSFPPYFPLTLRASLCRLRGFPLASLRRFGRFPFFLYSSIRPYAHRQRIEPALPIGFMAQNKSGYLLRPTGILRIVLIYEHVMAIHGKRFGIPENFPAQEKRRPRRRPPRGYLHEVPLGRNPSFDGTSGPP